MLMRRVIALQGYGSSVVDKQGQLHIVPDMLSRVFGDFLAWQEDKTAVASQTFPALVPTKPRLASICRNVPVAYQVRADNLDELSVAESYH